MRSVSLPVLMWMLLAVVRVPEASAGFADPAALVAPHRVLCIQPASVLTSDVGDAVYQIPFGSLLKIGRVDGDRCLVYDLHVDGWIESSRLMSLADPQLVAAIRSAPVSTSLRLKPSSTVC